MLGVIINTGTVLLGSAAGLLFKRGIPPRMSQTILYAIGLCSVAIGVRGVLDGAGSLALILSLVAGAAVGSALGIQEKLNRLGERFSKGRESGSLAEGFVSACLMFCVGAMTITGALNAGLNHDNSLLYTKSLMDLICSCMLAVSLGRGVLLSAGFVLVFEGGLVLLAGALAPVLTGPMIAEITGVGSVLIIALGLNVLGFEKLRVADLLPAVVAAPFFSWAVSLLPSGF